MEYSINTDKLKTMQTMLTQNRQKLLNKSNVFYAGAFSSTNILSSALGKIKRVYGNIPDTLENIRKFLEDYVKEIENYENLMSGNGGNQSVSTYGMEAGSNQLYAKTKLFSYEMDSATLFHIKTYEPKKPSNATNQPMTNNPNSNAVNGGTDPSFGSQEEFPNFDFDFNLPDFDLDQFDFNMDALGDLDVLEFSMDDLMNSMNLDLSKLGDLTMGSLGVLGSMGSLGNLGSLSLGNLGSISLGNLDLSNLGNLNLSDLDVTTNLILKDILQINGIDISGINNIGQLSTIDLKGLDLSNLTLNADTLRMLQNQISLGNISELDALSALQKLFPGIGNMSLSDLMKLYQLNDIGGVNGLSSLGIDSFSTGTLKGIGVSSALVLGFGALGGLGGAFAGRGMAKNKASSVSSNASSSSSNGHKNAFAGLGDAILSGGTFGVMMDANSSSALVDLSEDIETKRTSMSSMEHPFMALFAIDYDILLDDAFYRLKKFNQMKQISNYLELIDDARSMRNINSEVKLEERISFLIPSVLPDLIQKYYLYHEIMMQTIVDKSNTTYQQLYAAINNPISERFKWLDLENIQNEEKTKFKSALGIIDQVVNCGDVLEVSKFQNVFALMEAGIQDIVSTYEEIYQIEVPKVFHSDRVIDEYSSEYDILLEKLESLSVQAVLNCVTFEESKRYLSTIIRSLNIQDQNLYCYQEMERISDGEKETIFLIRIGNQMNPYHYYACYSGVGLKEIYANDVKLLMRAGFSLKEEK